MRKALVKIEGQYKLVDLATYMSLRDSPVKVDLEGPWCADCKKPVHTYDEKGAKGFRLAGREVVVRDKNRKRALPGFHHLDHGASDECPQSFANDPRYSEFHGQNHFTTEVKEKNVLALARPGAREAIYKVQAFFMQLLTGSPGISPEDRAQLNKVEKKLMLMAGLDENLWTLGYMGPVLVGPRKRTMRGRAVTVEYDRVGDQALYYTRADGERCIMTIPRQIALCRSFKTGKTSRPMFSHGRPIAFEVSRRFAVTIVKPSRGHSNNGGGADTNTSTPPPSVPAAPFATKSILAGHMPRHPDAARRDQEFDFKNRLSI